MKKDIVRYEAVGDNIIELRGQDVILDFAVAKLYGVETREINQAVKNNPTKFPEGYIFEIGNKELTELKSNFLISNDKARRANPKAFTEKGLYMLATILKGEKAVQTTIAIIEAFAKLRELSRTIGEMAKTHDEFKQKTLMQRSGEIVEDLFGDEMQTNETETEIELNFAVLKLKHTIKQKKQ
ncbi:MAG: ORF6N domain-containing protein [Prevotella sp.]|uniref:ORF6N domain-containing protein n=1 Tax=Prevotella sp. TaxID=59823 RepID=UPI002A346278|nr:ORF6N domain-containing protein [Prevotella sp.]MDD7317480.1 ORF6N domain-containing protein [Prevotellaceae bacterium]MDY4019184.1 ORF6N domain-containing protein [Prevotella sp.]